MTKAEQAAPQAAPIRRDYQVDVVWTGNTGPGTNSYRGYRRTHEIRSPGKASINASAAPAFRGDPDRYNPEELLVASLSQCHMLWYLQLAADSGVVVIGYHDQARGTLVEEPHGGGRFDEVTLAPQVTVRDRVSVDVAEALHQQAHKLCYIANSVAFPVHCNPTTRVAN
ncbi:OsmC family protein [Saccharopolyspora rectivirgula]|jgi:organic hydroperoxide reductase OsmC/OhrA|uniref:OsmC family protein n=1 Tax=Saccharopolyspora rectivirgula TaxID=28042 RepID=UPI000404A006|nr:OsmC family protein [Saccharopolyspora rectivirgula]